MRYFPLFIDLKSRKVLVVGGGEEALRKIRLLLKTEARIEVVATELHPELTDLAVGGNIAWVGRDFSPALLDGAACVFVAADGEINAMWRSRRTNAIFGECRRRCRAVVGNRAGHR